MLPLAPLQPTAAPTANAVTAVVLPPLLSPAESQDDVPVEISRRGPS